MRTRPVGPLALLAVTVSLAAGAAAAEHPPRLKVSENRRFLVKEDGSPFFYLGDTAWELFHRLDRDEAGRYLADRAAKGFRVIQAVVLAELDGLQPNPPRPLGARTGGEDHRKGPRTRPQPEPVIAEAIRLATGGWQGF